MKQLFLLSLLAIAAHAAPVTWEPIKDVKDDPGVATNGVVIKAYTFGSGKTPTVNGIVFRDFGTQTLDRQTLGSRYSGFWNVAGPAKELLDGAIQDTSSLEKPKAQRVTLHGLTPGRKYQIQLWVADRRTWPGLKPAFASSAQTVQASPQDSNIPTLRWQGGDKGPTAQSVIGTFTADKARLTLTFTPTAGFFNGRNWFSSQLNALVLLDQSPGTAAAVRGRKAGAAEGRQIARRLQRDVGFAGRGFLRLDAARQWRRRRERMGRGQRRSGVLSQQGGRLRRRPSAAETGAHSPAPRSRARRG